MRIARNPKIMNQSDTGCGESAALEKISPRSAMAVVDAPPRTTRATPTGIARVPTHTVRPVEERRAYTRAALSLPLRLKRVAGQTDKSRRILKTANLSSSGVLFLCPQWIAPGTPVEIEVLLVDRPLGRGSVRMIAEAQVVRADPALKPGWHFVAVNFDDIRFQRDEPLPSRFEKEFASNNPSE